MQSKNQPPLTVRESGYWGALWVIIICLILASCSGDDPVLTDDTIPPAANVDGTNPDVYQDPQDNDPWLLRDCAAANITCLDEAQDTMPWIDDQYLEPEFQFVCRQSAAQCTPRDPATSSVLFLEGDCAAISDDNTIPYYDRIKLPSQELTVAELSLIDEAWRDVVMYLWSLDIVTVVTSDGYQLMVYATGDGSDEWVDDIMSDLPAMECQMQA